MGTRCPSCNGALKRADTIEPPDHRGVRTQNVRIKCMLCTRVYPIYTSTVRVEKARLEAVRLAKRAKTEPHLMSRLIEARHKLSRLAKEDGVLQPPGLS
jgi:hypothetical protein